MPPRESPPLDWILDRCFISPEEIAAATRYVQELGLEEGVLEIGRVLKWAEDAGDMAGQKIGELDPAAFGFRVAEVFLPRLEAIEGKGMKSMANLMLGQLVQFSGLEIWESLKERRPRFVTDFLAGIKRCRAQRKIRNPEFFQSMGASYFFQLQKEAAEALAQQHPRPPQLRLPGPSSPPLNQCIVLHPDYRARRIRLINLWTDYGLVKDKRTILGFFNAEDQSGARVKCFAHKRKHIALLWDRLLEEKILDVEGPAGKWKVPEQCFVDEKGEILSKSFSKLLSKLKRERADKADVFAQIDEIITAFKK